mmetsp:Transcript_56029/g.132134  ORF Transcript_56029/g.132134 Transcript_56029/m.132134 type:complete len:200 (+) Transcript_56029:158-757(+)
MDNLALERADAEEREGGEKAGPHEGVGDADGEGSKGLVNKDREWHGTHNDERKEGDGSGANGPRFVKREPVFLTEHEVDPSLLFSTHNFHCVIQRNTSEPFARENLPDFLPFAVRVEAHLAFLLPPHGLPLLHLCSCRCVVSNGHGEPIANEICDTENKDDTSGEVCSRGSGDDSKSRHGTIQSPVDELTKVTVRRPFL